MYLLQEFCPHEQVGIRAELHTGFLLGLLGSTDLLLRARLDADFLEIFWERYQQILL